MKTQQINGIIRHLITVAGGYGYAVSQDQVLQLLSALATILGIVWSIYEKRERRVRTPSGVWSGGSYVLAGLVTALAALAIGCGTTKFQDVVTPGRVKAVVTWGAYAAAKAQIGEHREELERIRTALQTLQAAGTYDVAAVAAALQAGGITWLSTSEGTLAVAAAISFSDLFHDQTVVISESAYTQAVLEGALTGLTLALDERPAATRSVGSTAGGGVEARLRAEAEASR